MLERVEKAVNVPPTWMIRLRLYDLGEQFDLIDRSLCVMGGRANNLQSYMSPVCVVSRQPNGREVAPSELADYNVSSILVCFPRGDRMIPPLAVVFGILLLSIVLWLSFRRR